MCTMLLMDPVNRWYFTRTDGCHRARVRTGRAWLLAAVLVGFVLPTAAQTLPPDSLHLDPGIPEPRIENVIDLTVSPDQYERLRRERGEKFSLADVVVTGNGRTVTPKTVKLRGQTTLHLERKSLTVSLHDPIVVSRGDEQRPMEQFYLVSLSMDRYYMRNLLAFACMHRLGVFDLFHVLTELRINGETQGVYLLIQRPKDFAFDDRASPYIARRTYDGRIDEADVKAKRAAFSRAAYDGAFRRLYRVDREAAPRREVLLDEHLDLTGYLRWLAFNYFIQNGDYADEVYFYADPDTSRIRFHVIPWDYDDILAPAPHEGWKKRNKVLGEKRLYSSEDALDRLIAGDSLLYARYEDELVVVLEILSPEALAEVFEATYRALYPYYRDPSVIAMSRYDAYGETDLARFQAALRETYRFLVRRRQVLLDQLRRP